MLQAWHKKEQRVVNILEINFLERKALYEKHNSSDPLNPYMPAPLSDFSFKQKKVKEFLGNWSSRVYVVVDEVTVTGHVDGSPITTHEVNKK